MHGLNAGSGVFVFGFAERVFADRLFGELA